MADEEALAVVDNIPLCCCGEMSDVTCATDGSWPCAGALPQPPTGRRRATTASRTGRPAAGRAGVSGDEKGCVSRRSAARLPRSRSAGPGVTSVLRRARPRAGAAAATRCLVRRTSAIGVSTAARAAMCRRPTAWSSASTARSRYEHLYRREIANTAELAEEVAAYLALYNEVRPRQTLGQERPLVVHPGDQHLFQAPSLQHP